MEKAKIQIFLSMAVVLRIEEYTRPDIEKKPICESNS